MYANVSVVPERAEAASARRCWARSAVTPRESGKQGLTVEVKEDDAESLAWIERRGFEEVERQKGLELVLADAHRSCPGASGRGGRRPARRPSTSRHVRRRRRGGEGHPRARRRPRRRRSSSGDRSRSGGRAARPELCFVALADGEVVGFASVDVFGESDTGWHGLTAVARAWRGRGVATALKRSQIEAARGLGLRRLMTESEERNEPMRRLNEKLGYRPVPGWSCCAGRCRRCA